MTNEYTMIDTDYHGELPFIVTFYQPAESAMGFAGPVNSYADLYPGCDAEIEYDLHESVSGKYDLSDLTEGDHRIVRQTLLNEINQ